ncbi:uncharacterized protein LAESUDRAFT_759100 [Laetiporus sulphureus 93-53]|uniref:Uncharacterized protein n=1 Tax=Laetiporus sulphureus 93-53 TaxID=1314785 RepID=A0A165EFD9_9APHY|nr:uncharacterized protein LAESUDRAFT_759100 [Laetiporus sulphureus 93-53]KZT06938.1 hypothetical protein LAESUDRAFT_759100 [Laetiporus sulphureus 93-53]
MSQDEMHDKASRAPRPATTIIFSCSQHELGHSFDSSSPPSIPLRSLISHMDNLLTGSFFALPAPIATALSTAVPLGPRKLSLHDFPDILTELNPDRLMDPPAVIKIIRSGLKAYILLTALMNEACRSVHRLAHHQKETLKIKNGSVTVSLLVLDASCEPFLFAAEFQQAYPCYLSLIHAHYPRQG